MIGSRRVTVATFNAFLAVPPITGPMADGTFKFSLYTDGDNKDELWKLTDHPGRFLEVTFVRTLDEEAVPTRKSHRASRVKAT